MPQLKEFVAGNTYRADESGYSAFETLGRRVGGQYNEAGNDIRDIGRAQSAVTGMIGRWPFNIIELEQREADRAAKLADAGRGAGGGSVNIGQGGRSRGGSGRGGSGRIPGMGSLNQMSEGAGAFGRGIASAFGKTGSSTRSDRDGYSAQVLRERDRQSRLDALASEKRWDAYEKEIGDRNAEMDKITDEWAKDTRGQPVPTSNVENSPYSTVQPQDYGGEWKPEDTTEYGGGGSSIWSSVTSGLTSLFSSSDEP